MNRLHWLLTAVGILIVSETAAFAEQGGYEVSWRTVDCGGEASTGGTMSVTGTIAQADAVAPMVGGAFAMQSGFWPGGPVIQAPCDSWTDMDTGMNLPFGEHPVGAMVVYNSQLVAGGTFTLAGSQAANNIARWQGSYWEPIGAGLSNILTVRALAVYGNDLVAGGFGVKRWNGSTWQSMGSFNSSVWALTVHNGELIAAGDFSLVDGQPAQHIARWNGVSWQPVGSGLSMQVRALTVYNGELIAGGVSFGPGLVRWNGSTWQAVASGLIGGTVYALAVHNDELFVGGSFAPGGSSPHIVKWNGGPTLETVGAGLPNVVLALTTYGGNLVAGIGQHVPYRWNDVSWQPMGGEIDGNIHALAVDNDHLIAGGWFNQSSNSMRHIARWRDCPCASDINGDNMVSVVDLLAVISVWGPCSNPANCPADIAPPGGNDVVNVQDLLAVISAWGACP